MSAAVGQASSLFANAHDLPQRFSGRIQSWSNEDKLPHCRPPGQAGSPVLLHRSGSECACLHPGLRSGVCESADAGRPRACCAVPPPRPGVVRTRANWPTLEVGYYVSSLSHGAAVLASLRNLANGIYELARERGAHAGGHAALVVSPADFHQRVAAAAALKEPGRRAGRFHWPHGQNQNKPGSTTGAAEGAKNLTARRLTFQVAMESLTPTSPTPFLFQVNQPRRQTTSDLRNDGPGCRSVIYRGAALEIIHSPARQGATSHAYRAHAPDLSGNLPASSAQNGQTPVAGR